MVPEQHAWVVQRNIELQRKLNNRINENIIQNTINTQPPLTLPSPPSIENTNLINKLNESLEICQGLLNSLKQVENNPVVINEPPKSPPQPPVIQPVPVIQAPPVTQPTIPIPVQIPSNTFNEILPVLVLCYNRPDYLKRTLDNLIQVRGTKSQFPIIVSEDGTNQAVWDLVNGPDYFDKVVSIQYKNRGKWPTAYHHISQHFKFAIGSVIDKLGYSSVIILEDDMSVAPDFLEYFVAMRDYIKKDSSVFTASAWNDNGQFDHGRDPTLLKRSDFFPGLGWLMTKELWSEFRGKWPDGYWDDWIRDKKQRNGRHVIFPEISRSYTFGESGSSGGQFFDTFLKPINLYNGPPVDFKSLNLTYLDDVNPSLPSNNFFSFKLTSPFFFLFQKNWFKYIKEKLESATVISDPKQVANSSSSKVIIVYSNDNQYAIFAKELGIMYDEKVSPSFCSLSVLFVYHNETNQLYQDGIHRCAYKGVVYFWKGNKEVILADSNYKQIFGIKN